MQGAEPDGVYEVVGEWTFTAAPQAVGDTEFVPKGHVLETLENGIWTRTASGSGAAYTYPDFPRSNEKPQDYLGFCLKVFTTLSFLCYGWTLRYLGWWLVGKS